MDTQSTLTTDERIGRVVRALLDLLGIERQELAERIGMKPQTLGNKMSGTRPFKAREVDQIATALGVPRPLLDREPEAIMAELTGPFVNYRSA